mmetsp:Transcript_10966/g.18662  ORF Transcript_10966/g.18662 Transcript_10966/m.18662 type:complete len:364 (+) Transcript_10966:221-1312(+)
MMRRTSTHGLTLPESGSKTGATARSASLAARENSARSTSGSGSASQPSMHSVSSLAWEGRRRVSSRRSKSLCFMPNSRDQCSGGPYVSHGFTLAISSASPFRSSSTSSGDSSFASRSFQYPTTSSWSVHSRTTTKTGICCSSRRAVSKVCLLLGRPSVAMITAHCCPCAVSLGTAGAMSAMIFLTASVSGVPPPGEPPMMPASPVRSMVGLGAMGASCFPGSVKNCPAGVGFSRWKSTRAPRAAATSPVTLTVSPSSAQRVTRTATVLVPEVMSRCPPCAFIDPELSTIQNRIGNASTEASIARMRPGGKARPRGLDSSSYPSLCPPFASETGTPTATTGVSGIRGSVPLVPARASQLLALGF